MPQHSFRRSAALLAVFVLFTLSGCLKSRIEASGTPRPECPRVTVWQSYYGFSWSDVPSKKSEDGIGLYQATIYRNFAYDLIPIVTLGLVVPVQYEYQLQEPPVEKFTPGEDEMRSSRTQK